MISYILKQSEPYHQNEEAAAEIIQRAFRAFKKRHDNEKKLLAGMIDWRVAARSAIHLYRKTGVTYEEANRAATLIKAAYKGYYTRKVMRRLAEEEKTLHEDGTATGTGTRLEVIEEIIGESVEDDISGNEEVEQLVYYG